MWTTLTYALQGVLFIALGVAAIALLAIGALLVQDILAEWRRGR